MANHEVLPSAGSKNPRFFYGYVVVIAAFLVMVVVWGTAQTFGIFFKPVLTEFSWTRAETSGAVSISIITHAFISMVAGRLTDRISPRLIVTMGGIVMGLGYILMSQISAIWQLYLFYGVLVGIGTGVSFVTGASAIARWFVKSRGLMNGIFASGTGFGVLIMAPVASLLISSYGWRTSYIIVGIVALTVVILAAQFLKRDPGEVGLTPYGQNEEEKENLHLEGKAFSLKDLTRTRQLWLIIISFIFFGYFAQTLLVHIVPHVTDLAISSIAAARILAIIGGAHIVGKIVIGIAFDRMGSRSALIVAFIIMIVALAWLQLAKELWTFYLFAVIFGFAWGGIATVMSPVVAELFGLRAHGTILGVVLFSWGIGATIGPLVTGHIFDASGSYYLAFVICAVLSVMGVILALLLRPTLGEGGTNDARRST